VTAFHSFNNNIKFNSKGESRASSGLKDFRAQYNPELRSNLQKMHYRFCNGFFSFISKDFRDVEVATLTPTDYVYCDPPYIITDADYCRTWKENDEKDLLSLLEDLDKRGVRFGLSNVTDHEGKENLILKSWIKKTGFVVHNLKKDYLNSSPIKKFRQKNASKEVFVTNFQK
jgi:site-specific DNA-adenine methylase